MNREAHAALCSKLGPYTSACFQSIAVTFGTATSSSIDAGFNQTEIRSSLVFNSLTSQTEAIYHFVVAFDIGALQVIQQTPSLRDHFQQAASRMVILFVGLEMLGELVDSLAQKRDLYLR